MRVSVQSSPSFFAGRPAGLSSPRPRSRLRVGVAAAATVNPICASGSSGSTGTSPGGCFDANGNQIGTSTCPAGYGYDPNQDLCVQGLASASSDQTTCQNYGGTFANGFCALSPAAAQAQCLSSSIAGTWDPNAQTCTSGGTVYTIAQMQCAAGNGTWTAPNTCTNSQGQSITMAPAASPTPATPTPPVVASSPNPLPCTNSGGTWTAASGCVCPPGFTLTNGVCVAATAASSLSLSTGQTVALVGAAALLVWAIA